MHCTHNQTCFFNIFFLYFDYGRIDLRKLWLLFLAFRMTIWRLIGTDSGVIAAEPADASFVACPRCTRVDLILSCPVARSPSPRSHGDTYQLLYKHLSLTRSPPSLSAHVCVCARARRANIHMHNQLISINDCTHSHRPLSVRNKIPIHLQKHRYSSSNANVF